MLEDPADDLTAGFGSTDACADTSDSFDMATAAIEPAGDGVGVTMTSHTPGDVQQIQIVFTTLNGDTYDARARADGNGTFDGSAPDVFDLGAEVELAGGPDTYTATVTKLVPEAGWTVTIEVRSSCTDTVQGTLG